MKTSYLNNIQVEATNLRSHWIIGVGGERMSMRKYKHFIKLMRYKDCAYNGQAWWRK